MIATAKKIKKPRKNLFPELPDKAERLKIKKELMQTKESFKKPKKKKSKSSKSLLKECNELWALVVKERANWMSELSGTLATISPKSGKLVGIDAHHIAGKANYWLRFDLNNGIALQSYKEHINGVHSHDPLIADEFRSKIIRHTGAANWERLKALRHKPGKPGLHDIKEALTEKLEYYKSRRLTL